jgi:hypothetical protein
MVTLRRRSCIGQQPAGVLVGRRIHARCGPDAIEPQLFIAPASNITTPITGPQTAAGRESVLILRVRQVKVRKHHAY